MLRPYAPTDREALLALHKRSGDHFLFPDPEDGFAADTVVDEREGRLVACLAGQWCVETFLMMDPGIGSSLQRARTFKAVMEFGLERARGANLRQLHAHTPDAAYARRLSRLPGALITDLHHVYFQLERSA